MKIAICNAFSLNMLPDEKEFKIEVKRIPVEELKKFLSGAEIKSFVGHPDTASIFSSILGIKVEVNRDRFIFSSDVDFVCVGQYIGPRLPEGATKLPEGARIDWFIVRLV